MVLERLECVDAGSEFCPCYLAETNDCITCSHLQGKDFCDCNWRGICIYQEYAWNGYKSKSSRGNQLSKIVEKRKIGDNCTILKLKVSNTLARQLKEPGAYVFLRDTVLPQYFDTPMSIMDSDDINGYIYIAYQKVGAKTKRLDEVKDEVAIRGPYWNGIFGLRNLKRVKNGKCLVVVRGIAQAPSLLVVKKLLKNLNEVTVIVDKGKIDKMLINDYISNLNINLIEEKLNSEKGKLLIKAILKNEKIDLVYSGGSNLLHNYIIDVIDSININPLLVITNNNEICCGEGVCGSCSISLNKGLDVKLCKTQLDARNVIERRA